MLALSSAVADESRQNFPPRSRIFPQRNFVLCLQTDFSQEDLEMTLIRETLMAAEARLADLDAEGLPSLRVGARVIGEVHHVPSEADETSQITLKEPHVDGGPEIDDDVLAQVVDGGTLWP